MFSQYTYKNSDKFHQIARPIFDTSPITFISFCRLYDSGLYTGIMTDPKWTELYLEKHYQPTLPLWIETKLNKAHAGFELWSLSSLYSINDATRKLQEDCHAFNYHNGICIIDKYPGYSELVSFSSPHIEGMDSFFLENHETLRKYILYIKEKIFSDHTLYNEFNHPYHIPSVNIQPKANEVRPLHATPKINKYYLGYPLPDQSYLTQREIDCLLPFLLGVPKKVYAVRLGLSNRTIETYINNIMKKCECEGLAQLKLLCQNNKFISSLLLDEIHKFI